MITFRVTGVLPFARHSCIIIYFDDGYNKYSQSFHQASNQIINFELETQTVKMF